jgi:CO/xanthine dehydrogenase FAD-binding subunit
MMGKRFNYIRPRTYEEACEIKSKYASEARCLAGGTDLILQWRRGEIEFGYALDLTFIPNLRYFKTVGDVIRIGALTTLSNLENKASEDQLRSCISEVARKMCTPQLRTFATVGGNLCNASPAADLSVLLIALGAETVLMSSSGDRIIPVEDLFIGVNETMLKEDEILKEVRIPLPSSNFASSFKRTGRTVVDIAQVNAATFIRVNDDGAIAEARISLGAVAPIPIRSRAAEEILLGVEVQSIQEAVIEVASNRAVTDTKPITDLRGSAEYRRHISRVLVKRSIEEAIQKINGDRL